jgi:hypothetical protein
MAPLLVVDLLGVGLLAAERDGLGRDIVLPPPLEALCPKRCALTDSIGNKKASIKINNTALIFDVVIYFVIISNFIFKLISQEYL